MLFCPYPYYHYSVYVACPYLFYMRVYSRFHIRLILSPYVPSHCVTLFSFFPKSSFRVFVKIS